MAANQTTNYQLNQWEATDQVLRTDFNADNDKIDAALAAKAEVASLTALSETVSDLSSTVAEHAAALDACGNCKIWTTTYVGTSQTGASHPCSVTFPEMPMLVFILRWDGLGMVLIPGYEKNQMKWGGNFINLFVSWQGNTLSWYCTQSDATYQLNTVGTTYHVFALIKAD